MINKEFQPRKFHFIAVGGIGMSGLAKYLLELGCEISGSDIAENKYCSVLKELGGKIYVGHKAENVPDDAIIVVSSAIKDNNIELQSAKQKGLEILHRAEVLKLISLGFGKMAVPSFIGFAGTHGKTTTSGLCTYVLKKAGMQPSFSVGGIIPDLNTNGECSENGKYFVAELDESDGSIVKYKPDTVVLNNLEADHPDFYKNGLSDVLRTFDVFLSGLKDNAKIIVNSDSCGIQKLIENNNNKTFVTFGLNSGKYQAKNIINSSEGTSFDVFCEEKYLCNLKTSLFGQHNVYNSLAVAVALYENGEDLSEFAKYFKDFTGMGRRFQKKAEFGGITIIDDYAHHPTEIKATLAGAKNLKNSANRVVTIFQPHRYTRLKALWNDFAEAFSDTDELFVTDVYAAGDTADEIYNAENFSKELKQKSTYLSGTIKEVAKKVMPLLKKNDIVITMGAGDVTMIGKCLTDIYNGTERS